MLFPVLKINRKYHQASPPRIKKRENIPLKSRITMMAVLTGVYGAGPGLITRDLGIGIMASVAVFTIVFLADKVEF